IAYSSSGRRRHRGSDAGFSFSRSTNSAVFCVTSYLRRNGCLLLEQYSAQLLSLGWCETGREALYRFAKRVLDPAFQDLAIDLSCGERWHGWIVRRKHDVGDLLRLWRIHQSHYGCLPGCPPLIRRAAVDRRSLHDPEPFVQIFRREGRLQRERRCPGPEIAVAM